MSEEIVIQHCSPTLAGIKTGSLFTCAYDSIDSIDSDVAELNKRFAPKGLQVVILKYAKRALIYIYRGIQLAKDFMHPKARQILTERGYHTENINSCIQQLKKRFDTNAEFPH